MHSDDSIERYLNAVSQYEEEKKAAYEAWRSAFIELAHARIIKDVSVLGHDPEVPASTTIDTLSLRVSNKLPPIMGAFPPEPLRNARSQFIEALTHEIKALQYRINQETAIGSS